MDLRFLQRVLTRAGPKTAFQSAGLLVHTCILQRAGCLDNDELLVPPDWNAYPSTMTFLYRGIRTLPSMKVTVEQQEFNLVVTMTVRRCCLPCAFFLPCSYRLSRMSVCVLRQSIRCSCWFPVIFLTVLTLPSACARMMSCCSLPLAFRRYVRRWSMSACRPWR